MKGKKEKSECREGVESHRGQRRETNIGICEFVARTGVAVELGEEAGHAVGAESVETVGGAEDHEGHVAAAEDGELHRLLEDAGAALGKCILGRFSGGFFFCVFGMQLLLLEGDKPGGCARL